MSQQVGARRPWVRTRVAHPVRDLDRSVAFYRDLLGLSLTGGFRDHAGYDGAFFALPGGGELELTAGPVEPDGGTAEDLIVFYVAKLDDVAQIADELLAAGIASTPAKNPYWNHWGRMLVDPDGYRVVIAAQGDDETHEDGGR